MKLYALTAVLAFSLIGFGADAAKADYPCCDKPHYHKESFVTKPFHVVKHAIIFGCDGYHCETNVILDRGLSIKARCRNGWCELREIPLKNAWVLESNLEKLAHERAGYKDDRRLSHYPAVEHDNAYDNEHDHDHDDEHEGGEYDRY